MSDLAPLLVRLDGTGVVLTTAFEGRLAGCFATYVGAASMDPPRLIACTSHENLTHELVDRSGVLAVHVLGREHAHLVERFGLQSGRFADKFEGLAYRLGETGAPILEDCLGFVEGRVLASLETGDHTARLVDPVASALADHASTPLTSFEVLGRGLDRRSPPAGRWTGFEPDPNQHQGMLPARERSLARAATRPLNLAVLAVLLLFAIPVPWILALAIPIYGVLVAASYRPPQSVPVVSKETLPAPELDGVSPELRPRVRHALDEQEAILRQLATLPVQPAGLARQVQQLGRDLVTAARRVSEVDDYLRGVDADALRARLAAQEERAGKAAPALAEQVELVESLTARREALDDELEHVDAVLGTIRARLVTAGLGLDEAGRLRDEVDDLREIVGALADGLAEAYERRALGPGS